MSKKTMCFIFLLILALFISGCNGGKEDEINWQVYANEYYEVKYPEGWDVIAFNNSVTFSKGEANDIWDVSVKPVGVDGKEGFHEDIKKSKEESEKAGDVIEEILETEIGGQPAYKVKVTNSEFEAKGYFISIYKNNVAFDFAFTAMEEDYYDDINYIEEMVDSLKIKEFATYHGDIKEFIAENGKAIDTYNLNDFSAFNLLYDDLEENTIFLTGEHHGVADNSVLDLKFLNYLVKEAGVKYYLAETSFSNAQLINRYLKTGDESFLDELFESQVGTFAGNENEFNKWKELYKLNKTLPKEDRIKVVGVDIEHQFENGVRYMYSLIDKENVPSEIESEINELIDIYESERYDYWSVHRTISNIRESLNSKKDIYEEFLGEELFEFKLVNENIYTLRRFNDTEGAKPPGQA
ncbi:hypothetical protein PRVXT_000337 [Proteinivorax tanatarense]|uniref:Lipoprotein n=1 Tax=Proteinivorax tanatarense TaxID=1260629 RepID=A0AAU7VMR4_9FIRM